MRARFVVSILAGLLLVVAGAIAAISWQSAKELVHPERELLATTPADVGLAFEPLRFSTLDGVELAGWWVPANASRGTVVFLHGYGDSKAQALDVAPFLSRAGYHVLAFDMRAHGESGGDETTVGLVEVEDVRAAVALAAQKDPRAAERLALFGWSMGAATALNAAPDAPLVDAIVADSAFATLTNIASNSITHFTGLPKYPFGPLAVVFAGWMVGHDVGDNRPVDRIAEFAGPVLLIQGEADVIVFPDEDGEALLEGCARLFVDAPPRCELWRVPEARHVEARHAAAAEYEARVLRFLDQRLSAPAP